MFAAISTIDPIHIVIVANELFNENRKVFCSADGWQMGTQADVLVGARTRFMVRSQN